MTLRVGMIGCGRRARCHARGYAAAGDDVTFVGYADPMRDAACTLADEFGKAPDFTDHRAMLEAARPDMVSVCTWPKVRLQVVLDAVEAGVKAIHCEKPMALSWGEARRMHEACCEAKVQLTFCHQRRYVDQYQKARELIAAGVIGEVHLYQGLCHNFYDWGTHWFDMIHFFNGESPAQWVLAGADRARPRQVFGAPLEAAGIAQVGYENGKFGQLITGDATPDRRQSIVRVIGEGGMLEVRDWGEKGPLRVLREGDGEGAGGWQYHSFEKPAVEDVGTVRSVLDAIASLKAGREPMCGSRIALAATQLIFGSYLSSQQGGRVDLPLPDEELPLEGFFPAGVERGKY